MRVIENLNIGLFYAVLFVQSHLFKLGMYSEFGNIPVEANGYSLQVFNTSCVTCHFFRF